MFFMYRAQMTSAFVLSACVIVKPEPFTQPYIWFTGFLPLWCLFAAQWLTKDLKLTIKTARQFPGCSLRLSRSFLSSRSHVFVTLFGSYLMCHWLSEGGVGQNFRTNHRETITLNQRWITKRPSTTAEKETILVVLRFFACKLFLNWTACSSFIYTSWGK